ncbi:kinase [Vibrio phage D530]
MITFENLYVQQLIKIAESTVHGIRANDYVDSQLHLFEIEAKEAGFVKLGSGFFSQAWTHPAIKHFAIKLGFKKEDSGAAYAAFCRDNQGMTGIPTIYGIDRFRSCYVVLMDRYLPYKKIESIYNSKKEYFELTDKGEVIKPRCLSDYEECRDVTYYHWKDPKSAIGHTMKKIKDYFEGIASFDLHKENIMVDKLGCLVITDPVSFMKTEKQEHREIKKAHGILTAHNMAFMANNMLGMERRGGLQFNGMFHDEICKIEAGSCHKELPKIARGADNAAKPAFLVAQDARRIFKRK